MRLIQTDIPTEELDAAKTNLGTPGSVIDDDHLEDARREVNAAIDAAEHGDGSYEDRLEEAVVHATRAHDAIGEFVRRLEILYGSGRLRISNGSAVAILAAARSVDGTLGEWLDWARHELAHLD